MLRIFHVPAHLDYVDKLAASHFVPVSSPSGAVLNVAGLLSLDSWDFFDVLHLHTVELASVSELERLGERLRLANKAMVFTLHDLVPNIEDNRFMFEAKVRAAIKYAATVVTLTIFAAEHIADRFGVRPTVIPHGYSVPPELRRAPLPGHGGFLVFGAFRPKRDLLGVVRAWRLMSPRWLPLHVVMRSVRRSDWGRYAVEIAELKKVAHDEPGMTLELHEGFLPRDELIDRCRDVATLVLPYRMITHSGQLELARDLGLSLVAPDVPTLRAQISETWNDHERVIWFPKNDLDREKLFARHLQDADRLCDSFGTGRRMFSQFRKREHEEILRKYGAVYRRCCTQR